MDTLIAQKWQGAARWLSLAVAGFYLFEAIPLFLGKLNDVGAGVGLFIGLVVGAATLTGNSKLPLGMTVLTAVQVAGFFVDAFAGTIFLRLAVQLALLAITTGAAVALWKAHRANTI
jgi:hypothetical protein